MGWNEDDRRSTNNQNEWRGADMRGGQRAGNYPPRDQDPRQYDQAYPYEGRGYGDVQDYHDYRRWGRGFDQGYGPGRESGYERTGSEMGRDVDRFHGGFSRRRSHETPEYGFDPVQWREKSHVGRGPKGYRRPKERIQEEVCERLTRHPAVDASEIEVDVEDTVVILRGTVPDRRMKRLAEDVLEDVPGIEDIRNEIRVTPLERRSEDESH